MSLIMTAYEGPILQSSDQSAATQHCAGKGLLLLEYTPENLERQFFAHSDWIYQN